MDTSRTTTPSIPPDDVLACYLEADDPPLSLRRPFPRAEVCVIASCIASFLAAASVLLIVLRHTVEADNSLLRHTVCSSQLLALVLASTAAVIVLASLLAYAVWRVMEVLDMANRYREHRDLCAYEEMRASFRSQNSLRSAKAAH